MQWYGVGAAGASWLLLFRGDQSWPVLRPITKFVFLGQMHNINRQDGNGAFHDLPPYFCFYEDIMGRNA
jgi:hypothetical protein